MLWHDLVGICEAKMWRVQPQFYQHRRECELPKMGSNRVQNTANKYAFFVFFLFFECFNWGLWGFNCSKMAKIRFLTDPNTFWMILGTSKISRFFGPVVDPRTPYLSWIYFKKYKKNQETPLENMDFGYLRIWESQNFRKSCVPGFSIFEISKFEDLNFW